ncbi:MAG: DMT family transporter [Coriobacteriia bacterium]|nr:DMT family transporter [Coriobacteriia bacterium]
MPDSPRLHDGAHAWKGYALAVLAAVCWATGGVMAKWLMGPVDSATAAWPIASPGMQLQPTILAGARAILSFLLLLGYLVLRGPRSLRVAPRHLPFLAVFGVVAMAGLHVAYYQAIAYSNVATAVLLEYLAPVIVLVLSVLFLDEPFRWVLPAGVALSVVGCALVVGALGGDGLVVSRAGIAWGLVAAILYATYQLLGKWASTRHSPWTLLCYGLGFASVFWLVYVGGPAPIGEPFSTPVGALALVYIALVATVIPFGASLKALHYIDATKAVVTLTLEPVIAGVIAWTVLGERFDALQLLGGALVLAAIVLVQRASRLEDVLPPVP